jgi:hypothetical protein
MAYEALDELDRALADAQKVGGGVGVFGTRLRVWMGLCHAGPTAQCCEAHPHLPCWSLQTLEIDSQQSAARAAVARLEPVVKARQEKMKDEMIGKLKDLGNSLLGKFGMSIDQFKAVQDPATGSYSIQFQQ